MKEAGNKNQFLVLTEGKRDDKTGEVRKTRLFVFSEDFEAFFRMLHESSEFLRANPMPPELALARANFWAKQKAGGGVHSSRTAAVARGGATAVAAPGDSRTRRS